MLFYIASRSNPPPPPPFIISPVISSLPAVFTFLSLTTLTSASALPSDSPPSSYLSKSHQTRTSALQPIPEYLYYANLQHNPFRFLAFRPLPAPVSHLHPYLRLSTFLSNNFLFPPTSWFIFLSYCSFISILLWYEPFSLLLFLFINFYTSFFRRFIPCPQHFQRILFPLHCNFNYIISPHTLWVLSPHPR